jgi:hypothetical protein
MEAGIEVKRQTLPRYLVSYAKPGRSTAWISSGQMDCA